MTQFVAGFGKNFLIDTQHGYTPPGVAVHLAKAVAFSLLKDRLLEAQLRNDSSSVSYLGTLVYDDLVIQGGRYFAQTDIEQAEPIPYEGIRIQSVLIEVSQSKNIVTTPMQGRDGTVKEYISKGDYAVSLSGGIVGETQGEDMIDFASNSRATDIGNRFPDVDVQRLENLMQVEDSIFLTSEFLQIFGITNCVVMNYSIPQLSGSRDVLPFVINLLSDKSILLNELEI